VESESNLIEKHKKTAFFIGVLVIVDLLIKIIIRNLGQTLNVEVTPWLNFTYRINDDILNTPSITSFGAYVLVSLQVIIAVLLYGKGKYSWKWIPFLIIVFLIEEVGLSLLLKRIGLNIIIEKRTLVIVSQTINTLIIAMLFFPTKSQLSTTAIALVFSGAFGNLLGYFYSPFYPIDYIKIRNSRLDDSYLILNISDIYIRLGVVLVIVAISCNIVNGIKRRIEIRKYKET